jgi:hypothetical protein
VDSAALAAVSALAEKDMSIEAAKTLATQFFAANYLARHHTHEPHLDVVITIEAGPASKTFTAEVSATEAVALSPLMRLLGHHVVDVSAFGKSTSSRGASNALSIFLVLDRSLSMKAATPSIKSRTTSCDYYHMNEATGIQYDGIKSPCYYSRMESLKSAAGGLLDMLESVDPSAKVIRVGAIAYNHETLPEQPMDWGVDDSRTYLSGLVADGDTNSSNAIAAAVKLVSDAMEGARQHNRNGLALKKAIVFLTDGINNQTSFDTATLRSCSDAKARGITVYTVAFTAGGRGQQLLSACASSAETFFYAEDLPQLYGAFQEIGQSVLKQTPRLVQ